MSISRNFLIVFGLAVTLEILRPFVSHTSILNETMFWLGHSLLVLLGFFCAAEKHPYRSAVAKTWPFVFLWFVTGYVTIRFGIGETPPAWSAEDRRLAQLGYVMATIMFLPVVLAASAFGVWLGCSYRRITGRGHSNAA